MIQPLPLLILLFQQIDPGDRVSPHAFAVELMGSEGRIQELCFQK